MANKLSVQQNLPALRLAGFVICFYFSYSYPAIPSTRASIFSIFPQENFLLDK